MRVRSLIRFLCGMLSLLSALDALAASSSYSFAPTNQTSITDTAVEWNPILEWVSKESGISLTLKLGKDAIATTAMLERGEVDFALNNHFFTPERDNGRWHVIARINEPPIRGVLLTKARSPIYSLADLNEAAVAFPSREAFVAYRLTTRELRRRGVKVNAVFGGNQGAALSLLQNDAVVAVGMADNIAKHMLAGHSDDYRVLWLSDAYPSLPILASSHVPPGVVKKIKAAFIAMQDDAQGKKILADIAQHSSRPLPGFTAANDADYAPYRRFYTEDNSPR